MLKDQKWQKLNNSSKIAYIYLKSKCFNEYQEEIFLSFKEMEPIMTHPTFFKALQELEEFKFIEKTQYGGLYRKRNRFKLSNGWKEKKE